MIALAPGGQQYLDRVKRMRIRLAGELAEVINEYGPKVFEDFNEVSVMHILPYVLLARLVDSSSRAVSGEPSLDEPGRVE